MNFAGLSLSRQALLSAAAFVGLIALLLAWIVGYVASANGMQAEFAAKTQMLEVLKRQTGPKLSRGEAARPAARVAAISAPTETVAASELHKTILASLERAGGVVHSIQAEATTDAIGEGLRRLNAQINFDGTTDALQKVLFDLETASPFIFVDSLLVQPTTAGSVTPGAKANEVLRVTLVASSYWKGPDTADGHTDRR